MSQVIQVLGPRAFQHGSAVNLFEAARGFIIAEGMANEHAIFLEEEEWKMKSTSTRYRKIKASLVDICCSLPGFAAQLAQYRTPGRENRVALTRKAIEIMEELLAWRWIWEIARGGSVSEQETNETSIFLDESGRPLSSTYLLFPNNDLASDITSYDAALIYLLPVIEELIGPGWQNLFEAMRPPGVAYDHSGASLLLPCDLSSLSETFTEMFQTLEGQMCNMKTVPADAFRLLLPLLVAGQAFDENSWELRCIRKARGEMAKISGFAAFVNKEWENDRLECDASRTARRSVSWVGKGDEDKKQGLTFTMTSSVLLVH